MKAMAMMLGTLLLAAQIQAASAVAGPTDVVKQFYQLANQGKCADTVRLFTAESVQEINRILGSTDGFMQFCVGRAGKAPLLALTVRKETVAGDHAQVKLERSYKDGSLAIDTDDLIKVGGAWRISVGGK